MMIVPAAIEADRMNLIVGQSPPFALYLQKKGDKYALTGSVNVQGVWKSVTTEEAFVDKITWEMVGMAFTGEDLVLFNNLKVVAMRILQETGLTPAGTKDLYIGTSADKNHQFVGSIAGLRVWDSVPPHLLEKITEAEAAGYGEIDIKYAELGGASSFLKNPRDPEQAIARGRFREYEGGHIYWSPECGAHAVQGLILQKYKSCTGPNGFLGFPRSDELQANTLLGGRKNQFEKGIIFLRMNNQACEVHGLIYHHYMELGAEGGGLGLPTSDETDVPGGKRSEFIGGAIYLSSATGAFEVNGAIRDRYKALGETAGIFGFPISDQSSVMGADGKPSGGRLSRFAGGTIYWSKATGAFEVHGAIRELYEQMGGPCSDLGYPASNETSVPGTDIRYNDFERGIIVWRPGIGARSFTELELYLGMVRSGHR